MSKKQLTKKALQIAKENNDPLYQKLVKHAKKEMNVVKPDKKSKHFIVTPDGVDVLDYNANEEVKEMNVVKPENQNEMKEAISVPLTIGGYNSLLKLQSDNPTGEAMKGVGIPASYEYLSQEDFDTVKSKLDDYIESDSKIGDDTSSMTIMVTDEEPTLTIEQCQDCEQLPTLEEAIKERCIELMDEIDKEPIIDGIVCYVGGTMKQLVNECNCNMYEFKLFSKYLVTNVGVKVIDSIIKADMCYMNDVIVKFKMNDSEQIFAMRIDELMDLGLAIWVDEETDTLNLSGIEYRGLTKICCDNEIEL